MKKRLILVLSFLLLNTIGNGQPHQILCNLPKQNIKIENTLDIPTITDNGDGTITLIHPDQNITDIFSNHTIYDFYLAYPSANPEGELIKYYTIIYENKSFINELYNYTYPNIYFLDQHITIPINTPLVSYLDNKTFKLIKQCNESSETGSECPDNEEPISEDIDVRLTFNYDSNHDILFIETNDLTTCGNSFSAGFKGQIDDGFGAMDDTTLQLWSSQPGVSNTTDYDQPCHSIENLVYSVLGISCNESHYGNIRFFENGEVGQFIMRRENVFFSTNYLTFEEDNLSIEDNSLSKMKPFKTTNNPFLQIANSENQSLTVEMLSISGQVILKETQFESNSILLSNYDNGLYFIKLKTLNNQQKVFKFLNN